MEIASKSEVLYQQLCRKIAAMRDGTPFPTVRQLMAEYQVSQATVSPAITLLKERGLLESVPRQGMFVRRDRSGNAPKILMFHPDWDSPYLRQIQRELEWAAKKHHFNLEIILFDYREDICATLNNYNADLIVIDSITNDQLSPLQIFQISRAAAPVILCSNAVPFKEIRYVCGDDVAGGALAARHLAQLGHRRIGLLYCEPHMLTVESAVRSFQFTASTCGCSVTMLDCGMHPGDVPEPMISRFARAFRAGEYDFSALFAISDYGALKMLQALRALQVDVPGDLSILGFGNVEMPGIEELATIDISKRKIAEAVMEMAANILSGKSGVEGQSANLGGRGNRRKLSPLPACRTV